MHMDLTVTKSLECCTLPQINTVFSRPSCYSSLHEFHVKLKTQSKMRHYITWLWNKVSVQLSVQDKHAQMPVFYNLFQ